MRSVIVLALMILSHSAAHAQPAEHGTTAEHSHAHAHGENVSGLSLNDGERWSTDAALSEEMTRIRSAIAAARQAVPDSSPRLGLSTDINVSIHRMIKECKLPPKADATLHVLIGRLGQASAQLTRDPNSVEAMKLVQSTLDLYARYFDDPAAAPEGTNGAHH